MTPQWIHEVAFALRRLMERWQYPTHAGLDDIFRRRGIEAPRYPASGEEVAKTRRLRDAFDQAAERSENTVKWLINDVVDEMRFQNLFAHPGEERLELIENLRRELAAVGATLTPEGRIERGYLGPEIFAGDRPTVDRLQAKLRGSDLDPGAILGTAKDLLEATAKHLLREHAPDAQPADMPAVVTQAMRAAGLSPRAPEIDGPGGSSVAEIRQQVVKTAGIVAHYRNRGGDGHGHVELTDLSPQLADYIRHLTLAAVAYLLSSVDGRSSSS